MRRSAATRSDWQRRVGKPSARSGPPDAVARSANQFYTWRARKALGRSLRYRIQAMGEKEVTDCKKIHGPWPNCRGFPWEARQRDFITAHSSIMAGFYEPRATNHYFFTSRGLLEAMLSFWVCCREAAFESEATGGADRPQSTLTNP